MLKFVKMHGTGNDFIMVSCLKKIIQNHSQLAKRVCDRHYGIGADGLIMILPSAQADFRMRIFNSDGSEAEMCGNGIRCVGKFVYEKGLSNKTALSVETLAGIIPIWLTVKKGLVTQVKVNMGKPGRITNYPALAGSIINKKIRAIGVSMGNPHCVVFVENVAAYPVARSGPLIEKHRFFPRKTNVEFVQVINRGKIKQRTWERGAGETLACGTGASASVVAGVFTGRLGRKVKVILKGGTLEIEWAKDNCVYMTGPAVEVFSGAF
ncbi:MAG: diaminopimelate epimerase [Planctomycetota bacterium]